jgi:hypothetical protein
MGSFVLCNYIIVISCCSETTDIAIKPKFHPDSNPTTHTRNFSTKNLEVNFVSHLILPFDKPPLANHPHLHVLSEPWNLETIQNLVSSLIATEGSFDFHETAI